MTKISLVKNQSADKQYSYAEQRVLGPSTTKKKSALQVGYSETTANSVVSKIESKPGYLNAVSKLANKSNSLALSAMKEFENRGFENFSDKNLIGALNAIGSAWERFSNPKNREPIRDDGKNKLRTIILQRVENQTISAPAEEVIVEPVEELSPEQLDF
jgi:hypothetical protein